VNHSRSLIRSPFVIGVLHFSLSFAVAIAMFAVAWGSGLSDSYQSSSAFSKGLTLLPVISQAPIALIQWLVIKSHPETHTGLGVQYLVLLGMIWSAVVGWLVRVVSGRTGNTQK
jgi:ATP/ADP translocase